MAKGESGDSVAAVVVSAGSGQRMGGRKKNFMDLGGRPVLAHTLAAFEDSGCVSGVVVVVSEGDVVLCRKEVVERFGFRKVIDVVAGGAERQASVAKGLAAVGSGCGVVVVHDGARPLVTPELIERTVEAARNSGAAVTAVPVTDTLKEVSSGEASKAVTVSKTVARDRLRSVQTPQGFRFDLLKKAHKKALEDGFIGTDESSLVERLGAVVTVVDGSHENIKITTEEDLVVAGAYLSRRKAGRG